MMQTILDSTLPPPLHVAEVDERSEKDDALFADLAEVLRKHNALNRFGITLLHRHFEIRPGEVLLETTDIAARVQTIQPVREAELVGVPYLETSGGSGTDGLQWRAFACGSGMTTSTIPEADGKTEELHRHATAVNWE